MSPAVVITYLARVRRVVSIDAGADANDVTARALRSQPNRSADTAVAGNWTDMARSGANVTDRDERSADTPASPTTKSAASSPSSPSVAEAGSATSSVGAEGRQRIVSAVVAVLALIVLVVLVVWARGAFNPDGPPPERSGTSIPASIPVGSSGDSTPRGSSGRAPVTGTVAPGATIDPILPGR